MTNEAVWDIMPLTIMKVVKTFSVVLFLAVFLIFFQTKSFAKDLTVEEESTASQTPKVEQVNYDLPYPGLLPGNPLYNLKVLRDRIVSVLISDPLKKAEFDILASDKRINAGLFLLDRKKETLAIDTISKGNNYFHDALGSIEKAKKMNVEIKPLLERMKQSVKKHQEVLTPYEKKVSKSKRGAFQQEMKRMQNFEKSVMGLFPRSE